ncbi:hypothetical protein EBB07_00700 [Paenibacillaceae bacterium]|nr:hypothetical protein EBB07_00700 [Paenibacillaceae bacterium]
MEIATIIAILSALSGAALGWIGRNRTAKQDTASEAAQDATIRSDMQYLIRGVDDIRFEQRSQSQRIDGVSERVTRIEESAKSAHRRLDRIEGKQ